jgi:hypothetical protein
VNSLRLKRCNCYRHRQLIGPLPLIALAPRAASSEKKLPHDAASPCLPTTPRCRQPPHAVATREPSDVETSSSWRPRCPGGVQAGGRAASKQRRRSDDPAAEAARCPGGVASRRRPSGGGRSSDPAAEAAAQHPGAQVFVRHFAGKENHQVCQSLLFPTCCAKLEHPNPLKLIGYLYSSLI